jgi:hypothetical protein
MDYDAMFSTKQLFIKIIMAYMGHGDLNRSDTADTADLAMRLK